MKFEGAMNLDTLEKDLNYGFCKFSISQATVIMAHINDRLENVFPHQEKGKQALLLFPVDRERRQLLLQET